MHCAIVTVTAVAALSLSPVFQQPPDSSTEDKQTLRSVNGQGRRQSFRANQTGAMVRETRYARRAPRCPRPRRPARSEQCGCPRFAGPGVVQGALGNTRSRHQTVERRPDSYRQARRIQCPARPGSIATPRWNGARSTTSSAAGSTPRPLKSSFVLTAGSRRNISG